MLEQAVQTPVRVLLVEDNPGDARLIAELLAEVPDHGFDLETVERLAHGLARMDDNEYGLLLLDLDLPDTFGLQTLLRAHGRVPDVPIVVLTGLDDEALGMEAMHQGAQDYLVKADLTGEGLTRSLRYAIGRHRTLQHLRMMSTTDELTGLHNRRGFLALAQQQLKLADRNGRKVLIVFADLDNLKRTNDAWGHDEGDQALIEAAELVAGTFRGSDIVARFGGDEFVALMADCSEQRAEALIDRLQERIQVRNAEKGRRFRLEISVGTAMYDPAFPCSLEALLRQADAAMYENKRLRQKEALQRA